MSLPDPPRVRHRSQRPVVATAVAGGGVCLLAVIVGLIILGIHAEGTNDVAMTGLAAIGSTLAGGFAAWIGREREDRKDVERPQA